MAHGDAIYFHSPCFDGIASAVIVGDYLEHREGWSNPSLVPVNYELKAGWPAPLDAKRCAIVDFLYHPDADFWADHHGTTFLEESMRERVRQRRSPRLVYDRDAPSCAGLLRRHLAKAFGYSQPRLGELAQWADKTDAARYESPLEAVFGDAPALQISMSLALGDQDGYCVRLVQALREASLSEVASLPEVQERYVALRASTEAGLERLRNTAHVEDDGIVVFDVDASDVNVSRYAPYLFFPQARYSAGIVRNRDGAKITAMRNPWLEFESVPLGEISARLGGGGHQRVGSIALRGSEAEQAPARLAALLQEVRRTESSDPDAADVTGEP